MKPLAWVLVSFVAAATPLSADQIADRAELTAGVKEILAPGCMPGPMAVFGNQAFTVLTADQQGQRVPLFAAVRAAHGRALAGGHEGFFGDQALASADNARFLKNALQWLGRKPIQRLRVGLLDMAGMEPTLKREGAAVTILTKTDITDGLKALDVLCINQGCLDRDEKHLDAVGRYLQRGGGLLVAGPAWGWIQGAGDKQLATDHTGNYLLYKYGIAFADGGVDSPFGPAGAEDPLLNTDTALESLKTATDGPAIAKAMNTVMRLLALLPKGERTYAERIELLADSSKGSGIPTQSTPITNAQPFARLKAALDVRAFRLTLPGKTPAHPAAADFPGAVPASAPRIARTVAIDSSVPNWRGLGLYAAPGDTITVTIPPAAVPAGLAVQVGCHTDTLWDLDQWHRFPEIAIRQPLKARTTRLATAFGGTIYIDVPDGCKLGSFDVTVQGAVAAPRFVRGKTTLDEWRTAIRSAPAPWAELEGNSVVLSVPAAVVRNLDDPEALMAYWDKVMDACYRLFAEPKRARPERYCVDRQISAGYMHSGYPVMTWEDVAQTFVDLTKLSRKGVHLWGFYHEMGHNFQQADWTFEGTGEVTNNLFSVYGQEQIVGLQPSEFGIAHPALKPEECRKRLAAYLARGAKFAEWQADPFLALSMYLQVRAAFGWEPFTRVFADYRKLAPNEHPRNEDEKRDQWMVRLSRAVGRDLGPFFVAWGVPTSKEARNSIAQLPSWMPADWPKP